MADTAISSGPAPRLAGYAGLAIAVLGAAAYAALASGFLAPADLTLFGGYIYNYYFLSLLEGRFDIPMRVASLEGHYDPEGRAFVYHGIAPLLTRLIAAPFVDLTEVPLAPASVWAFATLGTATYHVLLVQILRCFGPAGGTAQLIWAAGLAVAIWFGGPGLLLSANPTLYNEAIAVGFFCAAVWVMAALRVALFRAPAGGALLILALAAGLSVHARVPMAVGLYAGTCAMVALALWQTRLASWRQATTALVILFVFGLGYLGLNHARFGDPLQVSGSNEAGAVEDGEVEYGFAYWGVNPPEADQLDAFLKDGTFAAPRMAPNLFLYMIDVPKTAVSDAILERYRAMTADLGFMRVQTPRVGMLWLWTPWVVAAVLGALIGHRAGIAPLPALAALLATGLGAALILAYGTLALRYRVDLWPFLATLSCLALARLLSARPGRMVSGALTLALAGGVAMSLATANSYSTKSREIGIFSLWDRETCLEMTDQKGFSPEDAERLCQL